MEKIRVNFAVKRVASFEGSRHALLVRPANQLQWLRYRCLLSAVVMNTNEMADMQYRRPSATEINSMKRNELKDELLKVLDHTERMQSRNTDGGGGREGTDVASMLTMIYNRQEVILKEIKDGNSERERMVGEIEVLKEENETLKKVVSGQQSFLERLDFERRKCNIIITGLKEEAPLKNDALEEAVDDHEKVDMILRELEKQHITPVSIERLGKAANIAEQVRPIKLVLARPDDRKEILDSTSKLNGKNAFKKIFIKKDTHPAIRKEYARLHKVEKEEREKPGNQGKRVWYDKSERSVKVNDVTVDKFGPIYFF